MASKFPPQLHVLVIEDDASLRAAMVATMESAGFRVSARAACGHSGEVQAVEPRVDAVVLDCGLRRTQPLELAAQLGLAGLPVVALIAARAHAADAAHGRAQREAGWPGKPVTYLPREGWVERLVPALQATLAGASEVASMRVTNEQLTRALAQSREINVVVGILMERFRLDRAQAFATLRSEARARRLRLDALASRVIDAEERLHSVHWPGATPQARPPRN